MQSASLPNVQLYSSVSMNFATIQFRHKPLLAGLCEHSMITGIVSVQKITNIRPQLSQLSKHLSRSIFLDKIYFTMTETMFCLLKVRTIQCQIVFRLLLQCHFIAMAALYTRSRQVKRPALT